MTNVTGFKSVSYRKHKKSHQSVPPSPSRKSVLGSKKIELPYIIDVWNSVQSRMSCSIQVQMLSGTNLEAYLRDTRVSTDKKSLVVNHVMSENALDTKQAFKHVMSKIPKEGQARYLFRFHSKLSGRNKSVEKLNRRDSHSTSNVNLEQRIVLPFPCEHRFSTKQNDPYFHGIRIVPYSNGERWLHVELVAETNDNYQASNQNMNLDNIVEEEYEEYEESEPYLE